ncbi:pre-toxin TG domain-containing protein [Roseburia sp. 499]|uniref:pre-toxin TG domain-containing protein n=1 Tax=Roseburia sp. 499 TaxID=1261634 RepID=UPI000951E17C|nr:pre-toxin TG domain-containing protein [Roseburia sp. 499]WVK69470.1 pre-toxin TG domain-containing protein [Roseburia sp. 499]
MNTEVKKVSDSWEAKCNSTVEWMSCGERLLEIDGILQECDAILQEVGLGTGFISKRTELEGLLEDKRVLWEYVPMLPDFVNYYLDEPLYKAFNQHATETISRIKLEDFWVDAGENNQIGITESYYDPYLGEYKGSENKTRFTFVDFLGTNTETAHLPNSSGWIVSTSGCVEDFARIFEGQYEAMNAAEMFKETEITSYEEYLEHFAHQGEFNHTMDKPFLSFVSSVLDITIIKPIIEACTGEDLITGEDLSDLERGLKVVFAIVDLVTLGGAVAATKCSEMELKKALQVLGKTVAIEFAGNTAACGVSAIGEAFDWPIPITIMLSLAAGIAVSCKGNKLLFEGEGFSREVLLDDTEVKQIGEMFESGLNSYEVVGNTKDFYRKNPSDPIRDVLGSGLESNPN